MILQALFSLAALLPDILILVLAAVFFGVSGGLISYLAHRFWFRRWSDRSSAEDKLVDVVHTSLLGFSAFVLALGITTVYSNLAVVEGQVRQEALDVYRLRREFTALGALGAEGDRALVAYVHSVADDEWPRLSRKNPTLSPLAQRHLNETWAAIRAVQRELGVSQPQVREALNSYLMRIEQARYERLASATKSIPGIVWLIILMFIGAASFMNGRNAPHRFSIRLIVIHMSAIGLVIALIMILDDPFRGETSVGADIILNSLRLDGGS